MDDDDDWEVFRVIKQERQKKRAERRMAFNPGKGWTKHHETHWSTTLLGDRLDYWPGPQKWRWRNETMTGDVMAFIAKRERANNGCT